MDHIFRIFWAPRGTRWEDDNEALVPAATLTHRTADTRRCGPDRARQFAAYHTLIKGKYTGTDVRSTNENGGSAR